MITTVAGSGASGVSGDGGPAMMATLNNPSGIAINSVGDIYIADSGNNKIRMVRSFSIIRNCELDNVKYVNLFLHHLR